VEFTTDWEKDAERRDLTVNSMFLGKVLSKGNMQMKHCFSNQASTFSLLFFFYLVYTAVSQKVCTNTASRIKSHHSSSAFSVRVFIKFLLLRFFIFQAWMGCCMISLMDMKT